MVTRVDVEVGLDALVEAARRLLAVDPERFLRVLALARAYVSVYDRPQEGLVEVMARCSAISPTNGKPSA
jgi:hypothetical protein